MAISVVMPALEMAQETGKLVAWRKREGESVAKGETLLEVETDKAVMEIEAPGDGILAGVKVQAGAEVPVGQTIAWIVRPGEVPPPEVAPSGTTGRAVTSPARPASAATETSEQPAGAGPTLVTTRHGDPDFKVNAQDVKFLKSLRISLDDAA